MKRKNSLRDRVRIQVVSADIFRSIQLLVDRSIPVFHMEQTDDLTYTFQIDRKHLAAIRALLEKRGDRITLIEETLLHALLGSLIKRPVLYSGMALFLALSLVLPTRILSVAVEGNVRIPTRRILEAADAAGITLFSPCAAVRSEKMKNALLSAIPELQWAGINTYGCRAVISVRERAAAEGKASDRSVVSSIVAARDGIVQTVTATRGTVQCQPGQAVRAGQVLISGFTDCGLSIQAERAQGEVYAQTLRNLNAVTPSSCLSRGDQLRVKRCFSIIFGKKRINLWKDSGICQGTCGRISREYRLTLPGGFSLPVSLVCDTWSWNSMREQTVDENTAKATLIDFTHKDLSNQMIAGTICQADEVMELKQETYLLSGRYVCREMIGRERLENGVTHEQNG